MQGRSQPLSFAKIREKNGENSFSFNSVSAKPRYDLVSSFAS